MSFRLESYFLVLKKSATTLFSLDATISLLIGTPNENFGINFDPSHFIWQRMDYVEPIYKYRDKIFHIHFKDIKIDEHKLQKCGILAYPLEYMTPKIPGLGDCRWDKFISALTDIEYNGYACVEVEDKSFEKDDLSIIKSLILSKKFLEQYVI